MHSCHSNVFTDLLPLPLYSSISSPQCDFLDQLHYPSKCAFIPLLGILFYSNFHVMNPRDVFLTHLRSLVLILSVTRVFHLYNEYINIHKCSDTTGVKRFQFHFVLHFLPFNAFLVHLPLRQFACCHIHVPVMSVWGHMWLHFHHVLFFFFLLATHQKHL